MDLYVFDDVALKVTCEALELRVAQPYGVRPFAEAKKVADIGTLTQQWAKAETLIEDFHRGSQEQQKSVPLATKESGGQVRLGGGFVLGLRQAGDPVTENQAAVPTVSDVEQVVLLQRNPDAHARPGVLCECGGVFDEVSGEPPDFVATMLLELAEVAVVDADDKLLIPEFEGELARYNARLLETFRSAATEVGAISSPDDFRKVKAYVLLPGVEPVSLKCANVPWHPRIPEIGVNVVAEVDSSSIECVGLVLWDIDGNLSCLRFYDTEKTGSSLLQRRVYVFDITKEATDTDFCRTWRRGSQNSPCSLDDALRSLKVDLTQTAARYANEKTIALLRSFSKFNTWANEGGAAKQKVCLSKLEADLDEFRKQNGRIRLVALDIEGVIAPEGGSDWPWCLTAGRGVARLREEIDRILGSFGPENLREVTDLAIVLVSGRQVPYGEAGIGALGLFCSPLGGLGGQFGAAPSVLENGAYFWDPKAKRAFLTPRLSDKGRRLVQELQGSAIRDLLEALDGEQETGKGVCISLNPPLDSLGKREDIAAYFARVRDWLSSELEERMSLLSIVHSKSAVDITPRGISKASGLEILTEALGVTPAEVAGIGDTSGDLGWMQLVGWVGCPANATREVKAFVSRRGGIVASQNSAEGTAEILHKWFPCRH